MKCPRDQTELQHERQHGIDLDACKQCHGAWYAFADLAGLERTAVQDEGDLAGTIEYSKRASELACPQCSATMVAFDYRGNNLELDACDKEHGFWLDAGESERVRQLMGDRDRGLHRSVEAERNWNRRRESGFSNSISDRVRNLFKGR